MSLDRHTVTMSPEYQCHMIVTVSQYHLTVTISQYHLAVNAEEDDHDEEEYGPERRYGHLHDSFGVGNESQAWTCYTG